MATIVPFRPRWLARVSIAILAGAAAGAVVLAWPLPRAPSLETPSATPLVERGRELLAIADAYAARVEGSTRIRMFDPHGHARVVAERAAARLREPSPTGAFLVLDTARRHADATVFPRWTGVFVFLLCFAAGVMGLWRARRAEHRDPGPGVNLEAVGLSVAALMATALLVGWTSPLTSTIVTSFAAASCGALMISGRVMPRALARPVSAAVHVWRIVAGGALAGLAVFGRRTLAPDPEAGGGEILVRTVPMFLFTVALVVGVVLASTSIAVWLLREREGVR